MSSLHIPSSARKPRKKKKRTQKQKQTFEYCKPNLTVSAPLVSASHFSQLIGFPDPAEPKWTFLLPPESPNSGQTTRKDVAWGSPRIWAAVRAVIHFSYTVQAC